MREKPTSFWELQGALFLQEWMAQATDVHHIILPGPVQPVRAFCEAVIRFFTQINHASEASLTSPDPAFWKALDALNHLPLSVVQAFLRAGKTVAYAMARRTYSDADTAIEAILVIDRCFDQLHHHYLRNFERHNEEDSSLDCKITPALFSRLSLLSSAFRNSTDGIIITDIRGKIIDANKAFLKLFGYEKQEVVGQNTAFLRSSETADDFYQQMWKAIETQGEWKGDIVNRAKNGNNIPVWLSITPIFQNDKRIGYLGIEIDMRENKRIESELLKSARLAMVGQMAAKVAHEIRNPLASMNLNAELLSEELNGIATELGGEAFSMLQSIMSDIERLNDLISEYLQFSRLPQPSLQRGNIEQFLQKMLDEVAPIASSAGITLEYPDNDALPEVCFDPKQFRRVVLNLSRNAIDSMTGGGRLTVGVQNGGSWLSIFFRDTGSGITRDAQTRIFEPFFTTKDIGTGLGLPLVRQIIHEHNGEIDCESKPGVGTTMRIRLPVAP